jgi:tetratricopeptide (TPR) repeat protein
MPRNPYVAGRALSDARSFFGREDVFRLVETVLSQSHQNAIVLFGQRRIGKTSVLLRLRHHLPFPPFRPVYFDLMDRARKPLGSVLYELAVTIAAEFDAPAPDEAHFTPTGDGFREHFLPQFLQKLEAGVRPVILFDEFDVLDVAAEENLPETAAARAFFPFLRRLMESQPRFAFVFVVGRKAEDLSINVKATFKAARYQRISVLDAMSARDLVSLAERDGTLRFTPAAVERLLSVTSRHPYFTQLMCQLLFDQAYGASPVIAPLVDVDDVEAAIPKALEAGENIFEWVWDGLPPAERVIFSAVAEVTGEKEVITEEELTAVLQRHGIRILIRELELAPKTLIEWEMLRRVDGGYCFFIDLMRRWVAQRKPLPKVKDELDRINPIADQQYHLGYTFYRLGNLAEAVVPLRAALQVNPNHLKARLLLGEALREQGAVDESVQELEEAYRYDEDAARYPLVRGLLVLAENLERNSREDAALGVYERVLAISPRESVARERRLALLVARGDRALAAGDYDAATADYRQAGADEKVASLLAAQRSRALEEFHSAIGRLTAKEDWESAAERYRRLMELDPENPRWAEELKGVEKEAQVARRYAEGLGAQQLTRLAEAQRAFADVVASRPDYKDAAERLASVVRAVKAAQRQEAEAAPTRAEIEDHVPPPRGGILWTGAPEEEAAETSSVPAGSRTVALLSFGAAALFISSILLAIFSPYVWSVEGSGWVFFSVLANTCLLGVALASRSAPRAYRRYVLAGLGAPMVGSLYQLLNPDYFSFVLISVLGTAASVCYVGAFVHGARVRPSPAMAPCFVPGLLALVIIDPLHVEQLGVSYGWFLVRLAALTAVAGFAVERWRVVRTVAAKYALAGALGLLLSHWLYGVSMNGAPDYYFYWFGGGLGAGFVLLGFCIETSRFLGLWLIARSVYEETRPEVQGEPA